MAVAEFKKEDLQNLVDDDCDGLEKMEDRITGKGRWSLHHTLVFKDKASGKFYEANYSEAATEQQDESPFEYDSDLVKCEEVRPVEKVVTVYERTPAEGASPP